MRRKKTTTKKTGEKWHGTAGIDLLPEEDCHRVTFVDWKSFDQNAGQPQVAWLGHACFLIVWKGQRILIDPVFSRFIGIVPRRCPTPRDWRLMHPHCVFLSHAHMDHMDASTLRAFPGSILYLPEKSERLLGKSLSGNCRAVNEDTVINMGDLVIRPVHARHGGWRFPWQRGYRALGYVFSDGKQSVYYAGDSAYGGHFKMIGDAFDIDLALLPVGAYAPQWFLQKRHLNPEEAVAACRDLRASGMIPFHFGAYRVSLEPLNEPLPRFARRAANDGVQWTLPVGI